VLTNKVWLPLMTRTNRCLSSFYQTCLVDIPPAQCFMCFDWNCAFFKTYYKKRLFRHLLVNFNCIWVTHISLFWFYTVYISPTIFQPKRGHLSALTWSAMALGSAVATLIMILVMLAEFSYIPTTWNNMLHLTHQLLFLITLALTTGPTFYVTVVENQDGGGSLALILGIAQFFISVAATLLFRIMPSGWMFGDWVASKSHKYYMSQTFMASYPILHSQACLGSIFLWFLIFGCKFTALYFFLTPTFRNPIHAMAGMKVQNCHKMFGNSDLFSAPVLILLQLTHYSVGC